MRLFYFAFESIFDPVFESQVVELVLKYNQKQDKGNKITLVILGSAIDIFRKEYFKKRKKIFRILDGECIFFSKVPYFYKFPFLLNVSLFLNMILSFKVLLFLLQLKRSEKAIFHCRTEITSYVLLKVRDLFYKKAKVICDCRGLGSKEILYKHTGDKGIVLSGKIEKIEKYAHDNSDFLLCVSQTFKRFIQSNSQKTLEIAEVPCCLNTEKFCFDPIAREVKRKELGIVKKFVVLYSGSFNEWQLPDIMIDIFREIKKNIKNSIFVLFTKDIEYAKDIIENSGLEKESYIIESKSFNIINEYLLVGDIGLIIREDNDTNRVAFPIKFPEYIRCGVPVLTSITSDVKDMVKEFSLGYFLKNFKDMKEVARIVKDIKKNFDVVKSDEYKKKISETIREKVDWDNYIGLMEKIYIDLLFQ